jgi:uncharacterized protein
MLFFLKKAVFILRTMIIKFTNYSDDVHYFNFNEQASNLGLKEPFFDGVNLDVKMDKSHSQIVIDGDLSLNAKFFCDRCNDEFVAELKNHFKITYLFSKEKEEREDDNLYFLSPEADKIDLKQDVVDYAILAVPMKKLCQDECKGLCSRCGVNLNRETCKCTVEEKADPIWSALLKKVKDDENK